MRKSFKIFGGAAIIGLGLLFSPFALGQNQIAQQEESKGPPGHDKAIETLSPEEEQKGVGSREVQRPDGHKDKIYYSITTPEEEKKARQEEKEKQEKAWDMLRNIIIDPRSKVKGR